MVEMMMHTQIFITLSLCMPYSLACIDHMSRPFLSICQQVFIVCLRHARTLMDIGYLYESK